MQSQSNIAGRPYSVDVDPRDLELCGIKARYAQDMTCEDMRALVNWCNCQTESLWDGMNLQEILNVYRVSARYVTWESWCEESPSVALGAWNRVVTNANFLRN